MIKGRVAENPPEEARLEGLVQQKQIDKAYFREAVVSGESGKGIFIGDPNSSSAGWRDITADISVRGVGSNDPTWEVIDAGSPFRAYKFAVNDVCWMAYHIPHDILPNSEIHFHTHWISDGTNVNPVKWQWQYMYQKGFSQGVFDPSGTTITAEETPTGTAFTHYVTETAGVTIPGLSEPDGILYCCIKRIANGATDNTDGIFLLTADIHMQSIGIDATPNKSPGFYA